MDMWIARLTATFPHTHSPAKSQTFFDFGFNVKTDRSDSNLDWNLLQRHPTDALHGLSLWQFEEFLNRRIVIRQ